MVGTRLDDDLAPSGVTSGKPDRQRDGFTTTRRGPYKAISCDRDKFFDELRPLDLKLRACPHVNGLRNLLVKRVYHPLIPVTQDQRAMPHDVIHVLIAVNVPLLPAQRLRGVYGEGLGKPGVMGDAACETVLSLLKELLRRRMLLDVLSF